MQAREVLDSSCDVDGAANEGVLNQVLAHHQARDADAAVEADAHCKRWVAVLLELSLVILELHSHRQGGVGASSVCKRFGSRAPNIASQAVTDQGGDVFPGVP